MITIDSIEKKMKSLNDKIIKINSEYGSNITQELIIRIEKTVESFFLDFKATSSKSFDNYWKNIEKMKVQKNKAKLNIEDKNKDLEKLNVPKFVSEYKKKK